LNGGHPGQLGGGTLPKFLWAGGLLFGKEGERELAQGGQFLKGRGPLSRCGKRERVYSASHLGMFERKKKPGSDVGTVGRVGLYEMLTIKKY